ncbi:ATP-binding cassette sub-family C member 4 isoform X2 [Anabrus simplex]|uniref:ATP-binding cassette sub-family C member 4 isoform X2 n=1 Tax=Anabrus simplex TaxID=316456 RepID=UPI0035A26E67
MDSTQKHDKTHPYLKANIISKMLVWWLKDLFLLGRRKDLEAEDLYNTLPQDRSEKLGNDLERHWLKEISSGSPDLTRALTRTFLWSMVDHGTIYLLYSCVFRVGQAMFLSKLIDSFYRDSATADVTWYRSWYAAGLITCSLCCIFGLAHFYNRGKENGMRIRVALCSLLYRKVLRLNKCTTAKSAAAQAINLMTNDVIRFDEAPFKLDGLLTPIQAVVVTACVWHLMGVSAVIGIITLTILTSPLQMYLGKLSGKYRLMVAERTDRRLLLLSEIISAIQMVKMYAWEKPFSTMVQLARNSELRAVRLANYVRGHVLTGLLTADRIALLFTLLPYVLLGNHVTAAQVYAVTEMYNTLKLGLAYFLPLALTALGECKVSIGRIEFLLLEETVIKAPLTEDSGGCEDGSVVLTDVKAGWIPNSHACTLTDISLHIKPGMLCAVVGHIGSGKSSLLQTFLGELSLREGTVCVGGEMSYCSQEPWLFQGTVRMNVLFGQDYKEVRYREVLRACALERDLQYLRRGDSTLVGEKGTSLSGGQRARINLARAVYRKADIYLLDNPLASVDTEVARQLFTECICTFLKGKTRILVTYQRQFLEQVDLILVLNNGHIAGVGTYQELVSDSFIFNQLMDKTDDLLPEENSSKETKEKEPDKFEGTEKQVEKQTQDEEDADSETAELLAKGRVHKKVYSKYLLAGSSVFRVVMLVAVFVISHGVLCTTDWWTAYWINQVNVRKNFTIAPPPEVRKENISHTPKATHVPHHRNHSASEMIVSAIEILETLDMKYILNNLKHATVTRHEHHTLPPSLRGWNDSDSTSKNSTGYESSTVSLLPGLNSNHPVSGVQGTGTSNNSDTNLLLRNISVPDNAIASLNGSSMLVKNDSDSSQLHGTSLLTGKTVLDNSSSLLQRSDNSDFRFANVTTSSPVPEGISYNQSRVLNSSDFNFLGQERLIKNVSSGDNTSVNSSDFRMLTDNALVNNSKSEGNMAVTQNLTSLQESRGGGLDKATLLKNNTQGLELAVNHSLSRQHNLNSSDINVLNNEQVLKHTTPRQVSNINNGTLAVLRDHKTNESLENDTSVKRLPHVKESFSTTPTFTEVNNRTILKPGQGMSLATERSLPTEILAVTFHNSHLTSANMLKARDGLEPTSTEKPNLTNSNTRHEATTVEAEYDFPSLKTSTAENLGEFKTVQGEGISSSEIKIVGKTASRLDRNETRQSNHDAGTVNNKNDSKVHAVRRRGIDENRTVEWSTNELQKDKSKDKEAIILETNNSDMNISNSLPPSDVSDRDPAVSVNTRTEARSDFVSGGPVTIYSTTTQTNMQINSSDQGRNETSNGMNMSKTPSNLEISTEKLHLNSTANSSQENIVVSQENFASSTSTVKTSVSQNYSTTTSSLPKSTASSTARNITDIRKTEKVSDKSAQQNELIHKKLHYFNTTFKEVSSNTNTHVNSTEGFTQEQAVSERYLWIYTALVAGSTLIMALRTNFLVDLCTRSSKGLHEKMFSSVLHTTMRFFDTNPSGRIMNRFSKDVGTVDEMIPFLLLVAVQIVFVATGIIILAAMQNAWILIPLVVAAFMFWKVSQLYLATADDVKRLEGVTRSPVFSHLAATLDGLATIRAARMQSLLKQEFDALQDQHTSAWSLTILTSTFLNVWIDLVCTLFMTCVIVLFVLFADEMPSGSVGLALSQILVLLGMVSMGVMFSTTVANLMVSVERLVQYSELEREPGSEPGAGQRPPGGWPALGGLEMENVDVSYTSTGPLVLRNLNLTIKPGEKVGIVGRTGAGKTSMVNALFRLISTRGTIMIDGTDTGRLSLKDLREKISIIPQNPVVFSAPLRVNLDPTGKIPDAELWEALAQVELRDSVPSLNFVVNEGGSNFSAGQRQLLCLARVLLRKNKILVMDEATANVDPRTDALIQSTIRLKFKDCTVLTIAHRLNTIMDSDRVLVLDSGCVMEFDHPYLLLQNADGFLHKMVQNMDQRTAEHLRKMAAESYKQKCSEDSQLHKED